jgi:hypothetical protein
MNYDDPARLGRNWNNQMPECMKGANMMEVDPNKAIEYIVLNAPLYAQAKANRVFIENNLRVVKARLMNQEDGTLGAKEAYAYSNPDYEMQLLALREAVEEEEKLRYMLEAAKLRVEIWKTNEFTKRTEMKNL